MNGWDVVLVLAAGVCIGMMLLVLLVRWLIGRTRTRIERWEGSVDGEMAFLAMVSVLLALLAVGQLAATQWV